MTDLPERLGAALGDRYRVDRQIGEGGMAVVMAAEDLKHHRPVAIKVLKPELALAIGSDRFLREIEIAAGLSHPNILPVHDSGDADGLLYFVMPLLDEETLRERLRREGRLPLDEAIGISSEVADALDYAHTRGLVHRDIKPGNILFQAGHAVVSDFGIARAVSEAGGARLTETGLAVGTPAYMSPEQATGATELDARTDVYSLGCVLYEMLAGEAPHEDASPQAVLAKKMLGEVPDLRATREDLPATVTEVVRKALETDPADRFATPGQLTEALTHAATDEAIARHARQKRRARRRRALAMAAVVALLAAGGWWLSTMVGAPAIERLAVLPIANSMNDPAQDFFVRGLHDALISELGLAGVTVIGRQSVMKYRDTDTPVREIAPELDLDAVIEGSAILTGDSVSIQVRLVDGRSEAQLWTGSYGEEVRNVMAIYRDVTRTVAREIQFALTPQAEARLAVAPEVDPEAYAAVLQGHFHRAKMTPEGFDTALSYYERALLTDPDNAAAYAGVALVWGGRAQNGYVSMAEASPAMEEAAARALELDDELAAVHDMLASKGVWWDWDWEAGDRAFRRTLELDPSNAHPRATYSHYLYYVDRHEEARAQIERALELDPFDELVQGFYGMTLMYEHRFEEGVAFLEEMLSVSPNNAIALGMLRTAYHMMGRHEEALEIWKQSYASLGNTEGVAALERGWEEAGYSGALRAAAETLEAQSRTRFVTPWQIGTLYARAGEADKALEYLERAYEAHDPNIPYLSVDPIFDFMRDDPRFQALMGRLGLPG